MPLSKSTTDQIRKEAEESYPVNLGKRIAFHEGCAKYAVWKEKAAAAIHQKDMLLLDKEGLVKALKDIEASKSEYTFDLTEIATKALESFNQNKVK